MGKAKAVPLNAPRDQGRWGDVRRPGPATGAVNARSKVWLEREGKVVLSDWRVELLEAIERSGSLARAAQEMKVPYRTAWYKLKEIEEQLGIRLLDSESGGVGGGGSALTAEAREIIQRFRRVCAGLAETVERRFQTEFKGWLS